MKKLSTSKEFTRTQYLGRILQFSEGLEFEMDSAGRHMLVVGVVSGEAGKKQRVTLSGLKLHSGVAHVTPPGSHQAYLFAAPDEIQLTVDLPNGAEPKFRVFIDVFT